MYDVTRTNSMTIWIQNHFALKNARITIHAEIRLDADKQQMTALGARGAAFPDFLMPLNLRSS